MFLFGLSQKEGWFYNTFHVYQRVNKDVYCYVSRQFGFHMVQLYRRGTADYCILEARSEGDINELFDLGIEWLNQFEKWDDDAISKCPYYIGQELWRENCWLQNKNVSALTMEKQ